MVVVMELPVIRLETPYQASYQCVIEDAAESSSQVSSVMFATLL